MDVRFSVRLECDLRDAESGAYLARSSVDGSIDGCEYKGGSGTELPGDSGSWVDMPGPGPAEAAVPAAGGAPGSSEEFSEESSGFAIRRPPND